ncbi:hypothetical protein [Sulfurirhabdus autotrophica]|uniref:hypothetical protein n=1 Tax=Sulfurirhabdus autotrophica TaxID=1706046 RepID=UPI0014047BED|nr:hypothetical protein [Sulfurirhabdus autotrophica]
MILVLEIAGFFIAPEEIGYSNMDGASKWFDVDEPIYFLRQARQIAFVKGLMRHMSLRI